MDWPPMRQLTGHMDADLSWLMNRSVCWLRFSFVLYLPVLRPCQFETYFEYGFEKGLRSGENNRNADLAVRAFHLLSSFAGSSNSV